MPDNVKRFLYNNNQKEQGPTRRGVENKAGANLTGQHEKGPDTVN